MGLTSEMRSSMIASTRGAAEAFIEDIAYLRGLPDVPNIQPSELRRMSAVLRRLLVEGDITVVAAPRIGRFHFLAPDNKRARHESKKKPFLFFATASVPVGNAAVEHIGILKSPEENSYSDEQPGSVKLRIDGFMSQPVLCLDGVWISRRDAIKYAANIASGVHSGSPTEDSEKRLSQLRRRYRYWVEDENFQIRVDLESKSESDPPLAYDPVLLELHAAAIWLLKSDDTARLETIIKDEIMA